jgi:class 3 adenylate cyclase
MENSRETIILVDDNPANLRAGKNVLTEKYNVFTAPSAEKMFGLLEKGSKPSLILLDIEMPGMSGYEAIKILKSKPETQDIPVIFLTGKSDSNDELEGLSLGAIDYITKPFVPILLLKRIEVHLLVEFQQRQLKYYADNLQKMLSSYLSERVVNVLLSDPSKLEMEGTKRIMTAVFTDIRNFSAISEKMDPIDLARLLNIYLTAMSDIILEQMGTIDKYEGDAIMAFFGAPLDLPDHAKRTCTAAILMKRKETELNKDFAETGLSSSPLLARIGINTGSMNVGNMGSERKLDYTIMGNAVNIAARLEGLNKFFGTWILVSEHTVRAAGDGFLFRRLGLVRLTGIQTPVETYELVDMAADASDVQRKTVQLFHEALVFFEKREWSAAEEGFKKVLDVAGDDSPSRIFLDRCNTFKTTPPPDEWDGVYDLR